MEEKYNREHLVVEPSSFQFKGTDRDEPIICSTFGCKNKLTPEHQLYGNKCQHCQKQKKINPTSVLSYPIKKSA